MMRIWLSRATSISIKEQLNAQFVLGILSGRLKSGEKLPSVRELARQLGIHANTVSAAYRDLAARGWAGVRKGSGVFVRPAASRKPENALDGFVRAWVADGAAQGFRLAELREALDRFAAHTTERTWVVANSDIELARVLAAEIAEGIGSPVDFISIEELASAGARDRSVMLTPADLAKAPQGVSPAVIRLKSMQDFLAGQRRPAGPTLIAVVSRSPEIHRWSSLLLAALGFSPENVVQRNPLHRGWRNGLAACDIVAADVIACADLPATIPPLKFQLVAEDFIDELRAAVVTV